jgi:hypothetical protein
MFFRKLSSLRPLARLLLLLVICLVPLFAATITSAINAARAAGGTINGLSVYVGYAEDKEINNPLPGTFPIPWAGASNTIFLGSPIVGQSACGALTLCYDTGAIRLDNTSTSNITINSVSVDIHSSIPGGKVFNLWGSFTVPAGKSVILAGNPPTDDPPYDNFDTSSYPANNCTPIKVSPTVTITVGGVPTTYVDLGHILDTEGVDLGSCKPPHNESIQWHAIGAGGKSAATLALNPASTIVSIDQQATVTALLLDGSNNVIPDATVNFSVVSGPNAGQTGSAVTNAAGQASFTYKDTSAGIDIVVASITSISTLLSNQISVLWQNASTGPWEHIDIGSPPLAGSDSLDNGIWTIAGSGADIGGHADQFHFVLQPLPADGGIRAQVLTQTNTNSSAKAGVMLRQSANAGAPFYAFVATPQKGISIIYRLTQGASTHTLLILTGTAPVYLQVQRTGTTYTASISSNGVTWTPILGSSITLGSPGTWLAGLAVTSHSTTKISTAMFEAVSTP